MARTDRLLTRLELRIMTVLWHRGGSTVQEVLDGLSGRTPLAYTTVQTMLNVLHRKRHVRRVRRGRAFIYEALITKDEAETSVVGDLIKRVFNGSVDDLVMALVKARHLDPRKLAKLTARIDEYDRSREARRRGRA
jgi:predicted transcriptional regulator